MITQLRLLNLAIVSECDVFFEDGMTVITGETGAGKSILLSGIELLLGKSASDSLIKSDASFALIEATVKVPLHLRSHSVISPFLDDSEDLFISRKLVRDKSNVIRLNHQTVPAKILKEVMVLLVMIVGQHDYLLLRQPSFQLDMCDAYVKESHRSLLEAYEVALSLIHI